jgi:chorismate synthase
MSNLEYRTAGESHGQALIALIEGMPAGVLLNIEAANREMARRQGGYGRGGRQKIERDTINILSGVRRGKTMGSPIAVQIANKDWRIDEAPEVNRPRPGHADLAGSIKWLTTDCRETLERASARETAARVAAGAVARSVLVPFGIRCVGFVTQIGSAIAAVPACMSPDELVSARDANDVYTPDPAAVDGMVAAIRRAKEDKDTVGGIVEVRVFGCPPGLGSCMRYQDRLDGRLMQAIGSIQAFKGAEIGMGFGVASLPGSRVHDEIDYDPACRDTPSLGFTRRSNNAGGLEGGMTNGQPVIVRGAMKPIATLLRGLDSVNLKTLTPERSDYERSDVCAVSAASVVAENAVAFEIARAFLDKFAGDSLAEVTAAYEFYLRTARALSASHPRV